LYIQTFGNAAARTLAWRLSQARECQHAGRATVCPFD
jgi:hypothetical protein